MAERISCIWISRALHRTSTIRQPPRLRCPAEDLFCPDGNQSSRRYAAVRATAHATQAGLKIPPADSSVAGAQMAAFRAWEQQSGERFSQLKEIPHPTLVINGVHDDMIPVSNSYWLGEHLPNAVLMTYPDSGHGSLFQFNESFTRQANAFLGFYVSPRPLLNSIAAIDGSMPDIESRRRRPLYSTVPWLPGSTEAKCQLANEPPRGMGRGQFR